MLPSVIISVSHLAPFTSHCDPAVRKIELQHARNVTTLDYIIWLIFKSLKRRDEFVLYLEISVSNIVAVLILLYCQKSGFQKFWRFKTTYFRKTQKLKKTWRTTTVFVWLIFIRLVFLYQWKHLLHPFNANVKYLTINYTTLSILYTLEPFSLL